MRIRLSHSLLAFLVFSAIAYGNHDPQAIPKLARLFLGPSQTQTYERTTHAPYRPSEPYAPASPQQNQTAAPQSGTQPESQPESQPKTQSEPTANNDLCGAQLMNGDGPVISQSMRRSTTLFCYHGYVSLFSGLSRTPLWSAELLTPGRVAAAHEIVRVNPFHPEPSLATGVGSELSDFSHSGMDRGHMSPNGDMPDAMSQFESFSLGANMVPQNPNNNRVIWAHIEEAVRAWTRTTSYVYVVTGPVFAGANIQSLHGRVLIPTHIFKAIWDPTRNIGGVFVTFNQDGDQMLEQSFAQFTAWSGLDPFPDLTAEQKAQAPRLPRVRHSVPAL